MEARTFQLADGIAVAIGGVGGLEPAFLRGGEIALRAEADLPISARIDGRELRPIALASSSLAGKALELHYDTEEPGTAIELRASAAGEEIFVEIEARGGAEAERVGINFASGPGEHWFGADVLASSTWPLNSGEVERDPFLSTDNQTSPIWLSSRGVAVYTTGRELLGFHFNRRGPGSFGLHAIGSNRLAFRLALRGDIREAFLAAVRALGLPRSVPPYEQFAKPSFCTWINFLKDVSQVGIEAYLGDLEAAGFSCGVFTIDDKWTRAYGDLGFDPAKFPDPRALIEGIHSRGMLASLWVTPFVDEDSERYPEALARGYLVSSEIGEPYRAAWWNGSSALIDLSLPEARDWFLAGLKRLLEDCGADGYKLDAGDAAFLGPGHRFARPMNPIEYTDAFAALGAEFPVNELRVAWLSQSLGLVQRLRDKAPSWSRRDGLGSLIPHGLTLGLLGYPFICADMIGGGWDEGFKEGRPIDEELFLRWTEASALLPIMQFSYAPWRLSAEARAICLRYAKLHESFAPYIFERAKLAAETGMPIAAPLFLYYPSDPETFEIADQYMLGDRYLVAPVLESGARERAVYLPEGSWHRLGDSLLVEGGRWLPAEPAALDELPVFELIDRE
jgi:myogenesis-regulating glycosidase